MFDRFARHVGVITIATAALGFSLALVWQVVHAHPVDSLLAGLVGTTLGALLPSPTTTQRVTVENTDDDPVPVEPA